MRQRRLTLRELLEFVVLDDKPKTASTIAKVVSSPLSTVSSLLKKMVDGGTATRAPDVGPLGGFGYCRAGSGS